MTLDQKSESRTMSVWRSKGKESKGAYSHEYSTIMCDTAVCVTDLHIVPGAKTWANLVNQKPEFLSLNPALEQKKSMSVAQTEIKKVPDF